MTLCLLFSSCAVDVSFSHSVLCHIFHIFGVFSLVIMLCKIDPQDTVEVPASVAKCKKTAACLMEKIGVSDKLPSGMSYRLLSTRCNKYGVFKTEARKTRLHINGLMKV